MQLIVTGRHVNVTEPMKEYAREKLGRIVRERPHINEVHVIMDVEKYRHRVEVSVRGKNLVLFCREETTDMYESIDRALAKLDRQLVRYKERHMRKQQVPREIPRGGKRAEEPTVREEPSIGLRFSMKPMYVKEALLQIKLQGHLFFIFLDAESEEVNFIFRMGEGEIGHLVPRKIRGVDEEAKFQLRVVSEDSVTPEGAPRVLRRETRYVTWSAPEEALESMAAAGEKYRFFMSTAAQDASVVYQQMDGSYALIEPGK